MENIKIYTGKEGYLQVNLNTVNAKELKLFEIERMDNYIDFEDAEQIRQKLVDNKVKIKQISNRLYIEPWTHVSELPKKLWEYRYINPKSFKLDSEVYVYDDVVVLCNVSGAEIICYEIKDNKIKKQQEEIFDYFWKIGDIPVVGKGGKTSVF